MTPSAKQSAAYNEFIVSFVERHEPCQATRDEAHERADALVNLAKSCFALAMFARDNKNEASDAANDAAKILADANDEESALVTATIAVMFEELG